MDIPISIMFDDAPLRLVHILLRRCKPLITVDPSTVGCTWATDNAAGGEDDLLDESPERMLALLREDVLLGIISQADLKPSTDSAIRARISCYRSTGGADIAITPLSSKLWEDDFAKFMRCLPDCMELEHDSDNRLTVRIGVEHSAPGDWNGQMASARCRSLDELLNIYLTWKNSVESQES